MAGKEIVQIVVHRQIQFVPIVQPGPLEGSVGDIEPQRTDQMQGTAGDGAGAGDIPGVGRDLRLHQYKIDHVRFLIYYSINFCLYLLLGKNISLCAQRPYCNAKQV